MYAMFTCIIYVACYPEIAVRRFLYIRSVHTTFPSIILHVRLRLGKLPACKITKKACNSFCCNL
jgi:hypothetical protein